MKLSEFAKECRDTWKEDRSGVPVVGLEHLEPGEVKLSAWDVDSENTFTKRFNKGQVLLGRRRVYLRKAVVAPFDGICSGDITVIEAIPGKILPELLPFVIQNDAFFDYAEQGSAGSLSPRVKWEHLKDFEVNLPSIDDQKALAEKLWAAYRLKESYKKMLAATDEMVKSRFIEMFGNPNSNEKLLPIRKLGDICENLDSMRKPVKSGDRAEGVYPYYGASGIVDYVDGYLFDEKMLLVSEDGANLTVRTTPIAFSAEGKYWVNNHAHVLRFSDDALQSYVEFYLNMMNLNQYITGTAQPKLNQEKLNSIPII